MVLLEKYWTSINTLVLDQVDQDQLYNFKHADNGTLLSVDNLILNQISNRNKDITNKINTFYLISLINPNDLQVLTLLNINQTESMNVMFVLEMIYLFPELKAIHLEGGKMSKFIYTWCMPPVNKSKLHSLTLDNVGLEHLNLQCLGLHKKLRMLTITRNMISSVTLSPSDTLWYLDLRNNKLEQLPDQLTDMFKKLRVLKIGGNNIHTMTYNQIIPLLKIKELDFYSIPNDQNNSSKDNFFYTKNENSWIYALFNEPERLEASCNCSLPFFFLQSMYNAKCKSKDQDNSSLCSNLTFNHFNEKDDEVTISIRPDIDSPTSQLPNSNSDSTSHI